MISLSISSQIIAFFLQFKHVTRIDLSLAGQKFLRLTWQEQKTIWSQSVLVFLLEFSLETDKGSALLYLRLSTLGKIFS